MELSSYCERNRRSEADADDPLQLQDSGIQRPLWRLFQLLQAVVLYLLDLLVNETQMSHLTPELSLCVGRNGMTL